MLADSCSETELSREVDQFNQSLDPVRESAEDNPIKKWGGGGRLCI